MNGTTLRVLSHSCDINVTSVTETTLHLPCLYARLRSAEACHERGPYLHSILHMDAPHDEASTSDADEREVIEAAHSDLYWDRVVPSPPLKLSLPTNTLTDQGDDM